MALRILLVQPDEQLVQPLGRLFQERGDQAWYAADIAQASAYLSQVNPDLMILDLHYPGSDWLYLMRQVRQQMPNTRVIMFSRHPDLQREILARENGARAFLRQPVNALWLDQAIQRALSSTRPVKSVKAKAKPAPVVRMPVRFKITLPYLVLALMFALGSAYVLSQAVMESVQDRFLNQLIETGKQSSDWMVREEDRMLASLRLMANVQGTADAIQAQNAEALRTLILPLAVNAGEEAVEVLDMQGAALLSMRHVTGGGAADYEYTRGETFFQNLGFVQRVLQSQVDTQGDKYGGLLAAPWGNYFYISGPVFNAAGQQVGVILVGRTLRTLSRQIHEETLAQATFYDPNGALLASTFAEENAASLPPDQLQSISSSQDEKSFTRDLSLSGTNYTEILGPWEVRGGDDLGYLGVSLAQAFFVRTSRVTQIEIFLLMAVAILMVITVGVYLANLITKPLLRLVRASSQVAQGNLDVKVEARGDDEVAVLAHSFNSMIAGLQEGSVYRDLLGRTVSPEVREQLRQTFSSGNLRLEGQEAVATVLMTDIRGFTTLSEHTDPATVLAWLNDYFGRLVPIVTAHGGVVNKFDGDAMLAFFGILPRRLSPKEGALAACEAAMEMLQALDDFNTTRAARGEPLFVSGIGVNTGLVIAGGLGTQDRLHYTIIGDTVNTTQRLEALTRQLFETSGAVVGHSTMAALEELQKNFRLEDAGMHAVKGKAEQIQVYRLLGLALEEKPQTLGNQPAPEPADPVTPPAESEAPEDHGGAETPAGESAPEAQP